MSLAGAFLLLLPLICLASALEINIAASFIRDTTQYVHFDIVKPALDLAILEVNQRYEQLKFSIVVRNDSDTCSATLAAAIVAEAYHSKPVHAVFGPACESALDQVARMSGYWNIPVFTAGGMSIDFANKDVYPTLTRLSFSLDRVAHFVIQILREHDWHHVAALVYEADPLMHLSLKSLKAVIEREKLVDDYFFELSEFMIRTTAGKNASLSMRENLKEASQNARIFLLLVPNKLIREILLLSMDLGMDHEEYSYIGVELIKKGTEENDIGWYRMGSRRNNDAKQLYQSLMIVAARIPVSDEFETFAAKVAKQANLLSHISQKRKYTKADINPIVAGFYDAVILYATAVNKTISEKNDPRNATDVLRHIWGNTFTELGLTGDIVINENGDREADYSLNDFDHETGLMVPIGIYFGSLRTFKKLHGMEIQWPGSKNVPPSDVPHCGFTGEDEKCIVKSNIVTITVSIVLSIICISSITAVVGFLVYKRVQSEKNINDMWWRLEQSEIEIVESKKTAANKSTTSLMSAFSAMSGTGKSIRSGTKTNYSTVTINLSGVTIAMFRGQRVAVKEIDLASKFYVSRDVLTEMNSMREVQLHDNVVKFYGMTVDEPVRVVNELCVRGSLRDIIENDSIEMDWLFRYSILTDVAEGMHYLHNSPIVFHGHLKSTNLLVDGRFTVKIADYGLRCVRERMKTCDITNPRNLFWTAPEHLRTRDPLRSGSPSGDVYSFAIICQEIIVRQGPFEMSPDRRVIYGANQRQLDPDEILDKVRAGGIPAYRPDIGAEDCVECPELLTLVRSCWSETPIDRPSFGRIKLSLKKITKGKSSKNFLDNLLKRLEQYSNSLEMIVREKTQSIVEETEKTEQLIHQMLPAFIASELKLGKHIAPEAFDSVTIFFSDVVGFKEETETATPGQAVDLMNDVYTAIDTVIANFDVYKVETIADNYLIASGVPIRNGNEHARHIARMALDLRIAMKNFKSRHETSSKLQIRIGINSGSCVAGVVGMKLPKYCLFGDTINTASRMQTNGEPGRIQISQITKSILELFGTFIMLPRGEVEIKGKGKVKTFWLEGEERSYK